MNVPTGILIGAAVFAGIKIVTKTHRRRQTDRPTGRLRYFVWTLKQYLHLTNAAMRPYETTTTTTTTI